MPATPRVAPRYSCSTPRTPRPTAALYLEFDLGALLHNPLSAPTEAGAALRRCSAQTTPGRCSSRIIPAQRTRAPEAAAGGDDDGVGRAAGVSPAGRWPCRGRAEGRAADGAHRLPRGAADQPRVALSSSSPGSDALLLPAAGEAAAARPTLQPYGGWESAGCSPASLSATGCRPSPRQDPAASPRARAPIAGRVRGDRRSASARTRCLATSSVSGRARSGDRELLPQGAVGAEARDAQAARGLLARSHSLLGLRLALTVALKLSEHLRGRVEKMLASGGEQRWEEFINQEVGGMSEALTQLAVATSSLRGSSSRKRFERPCFVGPLALVGASTKRGAAQAIEKMHANTHLPEILGAAARYEATGEPAAARAAMSFFDELNASHTFATGGSTSGETWLGARQLDLAQQHAEKLEPRPPRDVRESQLDAHLALDHGVGRRRRRGRRGGKVLSHAEYFERTLLNAVLGTQRGTTPGSMLYMLPMGSGVSKAVYLERAAGPPLERWRASLLVLPGQRDRSVREDSRLGLLAALARVCRARRGGADRLRPAAHVERARVVRSRRAPHARRAAVRLAKRRRAAHDDADGDGARRRPGATTAAAARGVAAAAVVGRGPRAGARHGQPPRAEPGRRRAAECCCRRRVERRRARCSAAPSFASRRRSDGNR